MYFKSNSNIYVFMRFKFKIFNLFKLLIWVNLKKKKLCLIADKKPSLVNLD